MFGNLMPIFYTQLTNDTHANRLRTQQFQLLPRIRGSIYEKMYNQFSLTRLTFSNSSTSSFKALFCVPSSQGLINFSQSDAQYNIDLLLIFRSGLPYWPVARFWCHHRVCCPDSLLYVVTLQFSTTVHQ
jgi:hypothetical protein